MRFFWPIITSVFLVACGEGDPVNLQSAISTTNSTQSTAVQTSTACQKVSYSSTLFESTEPDRIAEQWYLERLGIVDTAFNRSTNKTNTNPVTVAVLDQKIDYNHPDLRRNLDLNNSCHFSESSNIYQSVEHATEVSGIIAADNSNNAGINGIATHTLIRGFNILNSKGSNTEWGVALGAADSTQADGVDIFNQSYGYPIPDDNGFVNYQDNSVLAEGILSEAVQSRRSGKGALYFKAAGNFYESTTPCSTYNRKLPYQSANMDPDNNIPYNIVVGSVDEQDKRACYSASGSSLFFVAPGNQLLATSSNNQYELFSGTSAATPVASGIAALILERHPNLGWRDVRHIMLASAEQVDEKIQPVSLSLSDGTYIAEPQWQTNGAEYQYHNWYGFGRLNASKALAMAGNYGGLLPTQQIKTSSLITPSQSIPDNSVKGAQSVYSDNNNLRVESVQLSINLTHARLADLSIELISPSGMRSILLTPRNGYAVPSSQTRFDFVLLSQAFYGETSQGEWTLKVVDTKSGVIGTLNDWTMTLYGHTLN
ncbi:Regulatory P domain of the subtilisin-like proprotein convertase [Oceanospirillum multiglobuliferum]|uniref:P/Homo B domain-containing protein n=1 Tax=Oceanospirillum multiglobuliferum TaxID=64969 RepID=A0A1T4QAQ4_9GAMM|nr:S8 family serine peptidase [Oceanospirillum multiglobuliferum]OPX56568.1 hypothetical protein BTE48_03865 [Oceanospirillum multiglobuliferum]SKA00308.1 Regulatory P domain of the subtilisin-like proprotein convertase [Oceanospirillum multiglobuliferum]